MLGALLIAMAAGQLADYAGFVDIVASYRLAGRMAAGLIAASLISAELTAGVGLLSGNGPVRRWAATVSLAVAVGWSLLALQAFARGLSIDNCGCFGVHLAQPLRWWVLVEDVEFVALALWVRSGWPSRASGFLPARSRSPLQRSSALQEVWRSATSTIGRAVGELHQGRMQRGVVDSAVELPDTAGSGDERLRGAARPPESSVGVDDVGYRRKTVAVDRSVGSSSARR